MLDIFNSNEKFRKIIKSFHFGIVEGLFFWKIPKKIRLRGLNTRRQTKGGVGDSYSRQQVSGFK